MNKIQNNRPSRNIEVAVRMRPLLHSYEQEQMWEIDHQHSKVTSLSNNNNLLSENISLNNSVQNYSNIMAKTKKKSSAVQKNNKYQFTFDHTFGQEHSNREVYEQSCQNIINQFAAMGRNGTIFMYGQTTSGKTHTMLGDSKTSGIIYYSLRDICDQLLKGKQNVGLSISYIQIYNEQINDLLCPNSVNLKIIQQKVYGAKQCQISSYEQSVKLLQSGEQQRSYSQKRYHDHSSRSHTIFQVIRNEGKNRSVLNLVDLAGSQRLAEQDSNQETGFINKSLFVLSNVIQRLVGVRKNGHIPFRDSKLTRLLAPSLTGQSLTAIICTISPASVNFYETLSTLRFAACSRKVELKPLQNGNGDKDTSLSSITTESIQRQKQTKQITKLRQQNQKLKKQILNISSLVAEPYPRQQNYLQSKLQIISHHFKQQRNILPPNWQEKTEMLCYEYRKNISTLQKQYSRALINIISSQYKISKSSLQNIFSQFQ